MRIQLRSLGMASFRKESGGGLSPSPFFFVVGGCCGGKEGCGGGWGAAVGQRPLSLAVGGAEREREFAVIALTGFRAVNDSGLSAYQFVSVLAVY